MRITTNWNRKNTKSIYAKWQNDECDDIKRNWCIVFNFYYSHLLISYFLFRNFLIRFVFVFFFFISSNLVWLHRFNTKWIAKKFFNLWFRLDWFYRTKYYGIFISTNVRKDSRIQTNECVIDWVNWWTGFF